MKYRFYYTGIRVRNLSRSLAFYTKAIGMRSEEHTSELQSR